MTSVARIAHFNKKQNAKKILGEFEVLEREKNEKESLYEYFIS